ncbi:MAG: hypothetical protein AAGA21_03320 [Pseudomonadota bacterium]
MTERPSKEARKPNRRRHFSPRQLQLFGAAGLVFYAILSTSAAFVIAGPSTHPSRELFPFFTWSLFSKVSDARREYHIAILALNGTTFDPPVDMRSIDVFPSYSDSKSLGYKALQNLGRSLSKDAEGSDLDRERFAARFFGAHDVDYQINRHSYNPLRRWREGPSSDEIKLIGDFSYEGGS